MIDTDAKLIWDYMQLKQLPRKADAIFVLCSLDTRVANRAAELFKAGVASTIIVSGGLGKLTETRFTKSEAQVFRDVLIAEGIPETSIIIEENSTNTGENVQFTWNLLEKLGKSFKSMVLVQKPYMERRTYATFKKQWPDPTTTIQVTSPQISFDRYFTPDMPKDLVINIMVGDLQRIKEYPKLGFQIEQEIPTDVWSAYERLVNAGYTSHLMN